MTQPKTQLRGRRQAPTPDGSQTAVRRDEDARGAAARVARESYGKLVAYLAASSRDVPGAEDALADAFTSALAVWPNQGVPFHAASAIRSRGSANWKTSAIS